MELRSGGKSNGTGSHAGLQSQTDAVRHTGSRLKVGTDMSKHCQDLLGAQVLSAVITLTKLRGYQHQDLMR